MNINLTQKAALLFSLMVLCLLYPQVSFAADWAIVCDESSCETNSSAGQLFLENNITSGDSFERIIEISNVSSGEISAQIEFSVENDGSLSQHLIVDIQDDSLVKRIEGMSLSTLFEMEAITINDVQPGQTESILLSVRAGNLDNSLQGEQVIFDVDVIFNQGGNVLSTVNLQDSSESNPSILGAADELPLTGLFRSGANSWIVAAWLVLFGIIIKYIANREQR